MRAWSSHQLALPPTALVTFVGKPLQRELFERILLVVDGALDMARVFEIVAAELVIPFRIFPIRDTLLDRRVDVHGGLVPR